jgi:hypothetical protein
VSHHLFKGRIRALRLHDLNHLHLVELVLPDQPAGIAAVRARLRTKTRGMRGEAYRELYLFEDPTGHEIGE